MPAPLEEAELIRRLSEQDAAAIIKIVPRPGRAPADLLAIEEQQVWFVRFGR